MLPKSYIHIFAPEPRMEFSSFHLYLPAASSTDNHDYYVEYRFLYEHNPIVPDLKYNEGPNNPANRDFYRICQAFVVKKDGDVFHPVFRALQRGEIGFALREKGAGDFVG